MRKPTLCGSNRISIPESGCDDCQQLEERIEELETCCDEMKSWKTTIESWKTTINNWKDTIETWVDSISTNGYNALANKPTINGITVQGDKTSEDYLIIAISDSDIEALTPIECYSPSAVTAE